MGENIMGRLSKPPIHPNERLAAPVTKELQNTFRDTMFRPLAELFNKDVKVLNAKGFKKKRAKTLIEALKSGKVKYQEGRFTGDIGARLIRELQNMGATKVGRAYFVPPGKMSSELRSTVESLAKAKAFLYEGMNKVLTEAAASTPAAIETLDFTAYGQKVQDIIYKKTKKQIQGISIPDKPETRAAKEAFIESSEYPIRETYNNQIKNSATKFSDEIVQRMRKELTKAFEDGASRQEMYDIVKHNLGVSDNRCKFISKQEMRLITQKTKSANYQANGIKYYRWRATLDNVTRPEHRAHDGKIYAYDREGPVVYDGKSGIRHAHAGCDFNCRCVDVPLSVFENDRWEKESDN